MTLDEEILDKDLEAVRQEHEDFLVEVESALVMAFAQGADLDQVLAMIDSYNPESKDYAGT